MKGHQNTALRVSPAQPYLRTGFGWDEFGPHSIWGRNASPSGGSVSEDLDLV